MRLAHIALISYILAVQAASTALHAECRVPVRPLAIKDFVDRPAHYLSRFPAGGDQLAQAMRSFATFDRRGLRAIRTAIRTANLPQKQAIGIGMALSVAACLPRDGEIAKQIADLVKTSDDPDVRAAYLTTSGDNAETATASAIKSVDDRRSGIVRPGDKLDIPSTGAPKIVPDIKRVH